ncbi:MAG: T9SS type A sorting domain-containing protein [Bacteroidales bacterium]|nr:T9SS type A sorting domain-containing protein [Bacteroidales bacterium]MCF8457619.1 T9SS type A sorting domain-containing protein [Bacteroidales bacterium]
MKIRPLFFLFLLIFGGMSLSNSQTQTKLLASDGAQSDEFGCAVSIFAEQLIVGAHNSSNNKGAVYIFEYGTSSWSQVQKLIASDGASGDAFGESVFIADTLCLVGARNNGTGAAYIFKYDAGLASWEQIQILIPTNGLVADEFGACVAIQENSVFVSAPKNDANGMNSGATYIFNYNATSQLWEQAQMLMASNGNPNDEFGTSLSVSGEWLFIGASKNDTLGNNSGLVYVFKYNSTSLLWEEQQKIAASDGTIADEFGWTLSVDGNKAVVGAPVNSSEGGAYFFAWFPGQGIWQQVQKIQASDGYSGDKFGWSVSLSGDNLIIGSYKEDANGASAGAAYRFNFALGVFGNQQKILAYDGSEGDEFGGAVAIHNETALVGAAKNDDTGNSCGSAYVLTNLPVGIESPANYNINLFPNPFSNEIYFDLPESSQAFQIQVFSTSGQLLYADELHRDRISINAKDWPAGIYFVRVWDGERSFNHKIIKQ